MRAFSVLLLAVFALAACDERRSATDDAVNVDLTPSPAPPAAPPPGPLIRPAAFLEQACRGRVSEQFGQTGSSVRYEAQGTDRATVSWAAPVDGGVLSFECRMGEAGADLFRDGQSMTVNVPTAADAAEQEAR